MRHATLPVKLWPTRFSWCQLRKAKRLHRKEKQRRAHEKTVEKLVKPLSMRRPPGSWSRSSQEYNVWIRKEMHELDSEMRDKLVQNLRKREAHEIAIATVQETTIPGGGIFNGDTPPSVLDDICLIVRLIEWKIVHCQADSTCFCMGYGAHGAGHRITSRSIWYWQAARTMSTH